MKKLEKTYQEKFNEIVKNHSTWSSWVCFSALIRGKKYKDNEVEEMFNELVEKNDYSKGNKEGLLAYAKSQTWYGQQHLF